MIIAFIITNIPQAPVNYVTIWNFSIILFNPQKSSIELDMISIFLFSTWNFSDAYKD